MNRAFFFRFLGIILFIYVVSKINLAELSAVFKQIRLDYFLIGVLFLIFSFLIRIVRWRILVESIASPLSFGTSASMVSKGLFFGSVVPGRLGEFWRARYLVKESGVTGGQAFYIAFIDRISDILVVTVVGLLGFWVLGWQLPVLIFICLAAIAYFLARKKRIRRSLNTLIRFFIPDFLKEKADYFLTEFYKGFVNLKPKVFVQTSALAFLYYLFGGAVFHYFIVLSLGLTVPFWYLFLIVAIVWLVMAVPVSMFGLGTREAAFIYFFALLNISASLAVAVSLLALFCNILIVTVPAAVLFLMKK